MRLVIIIVSAFVVFTASGQNRDLFGRVTSLSGTLLEGVTVIIRYPDSSKIAGYAVTGVKGGFLIKSLPVTEKFLVEFRHLGYEPQKRWIRVDSWPAELNATLLEKATELKEIVIRRELPVLIRSDTVVFNANSYRDAEVRKVEDLLKKMQGFSAGPSGKLMFNGKPVEKVLIDGDDLAGQGYQMITKNLDAVTIDKVEVINNFSDNRLLGKVVETGKVGVNLKIAPRFKSKLSGSTENGISPERRYSADINTIFIGRNTKWLGLANFNNIARDVSGTAGYYYEQEGGHVGEEDSPLGKTPLETGTFIMPSLGNQYIRDNRDFGSALMNSWKLGERIRINGLIGYNDLWLNNRAGNLVETELNDLEKWTVGSDMGRSSRSRDLVGRFSFLMDAGKNQLSKIELVINTGTLGNEYNSASNGDIVDSLEEYLLNRSGALRFRGQHTWLVGDKVAQFSLGFDRGELDQAMDIHTSRFLSFWKLDSSYLINQQLLEKLRTREIMQVRFNGRSGKLQYEYGASLERLKIKYGTEAKLSSKDARPKLELGLQQARVADISVKASGKMLIELGKTDWFGFSANAGLESLDTGQTGSILLVYDANGWYVRKFGLLNSLRISYKLSRGFKKYDQMYPDLLMTGGATILDGLKFSEPETSQGLTASYNSINLGKQRNWSASVSYNLGPRRYINSFDLYPEYTFQYFELSGSNLSFSGALNGESYVRPLKSRLGGLASFISAREPNTINGNSGASVRNNLKLEGWVVSGLNFPLNLELRVGAFYSSGSWNEGVPNHIWQKFWSCKLKFKPANKLYGSAILAVRDLSNGGKFYGLDCFASYKLNSSLVFSFNGVNLLNVQKVSEVSVMPTSRSEAIYRLVPRYLLASVNLVF